MACGRLLSRSDVPTVAGALKLDRQRLTPCGQTARRRVCIQGETCGQLCVIGVNFEDRHHFSGFRHELAVMFWERFALADVTGRAVAAIINGARLLT